MAAAPERLGSAAPTLGRDRAFDPVAGIRDRGFDLRQIIDAQELELRLERARQKGADMGQRIIEHCAGAQVQVISGVSEGDTVVVAGQQRLQKDGTAVRVVDMNKPGGPGGKGPGGGKPQGGAPAGAPAAPGAAKAG